MTPREAQEKMKEFALQRERDENLKRLAQSAEEQVVLAKQEAESAKKDARFSKIMSILALLISAGSLAVAIIALAVR